ncbi:helix-turn-helix transcriptional regulator [Gordonia sp. ABSL11-1]|uniref:helix-turn-helix domain-containing protein n=1 Tax=Gordonia sp. ABSL11-1 TaxID=3053924 RepID=UPI0025725970|nr:helix-turn-helix transcriptional regulator [Gordonia sp. ABSL11-1]MDL9946765.1 helix-turn-helix transcriptional regulator [Gordonia sp. ABSL11-1]
MDNALGDFLRARRELVTPQEAGLTGGGVRRVPGLRREEVAMLAGISAEYYARLERGRDRTPSPQVVTALARVLHLDAESTEYLMGLAGRTQTSSVGSAEGPVPHGLDQLLRTLSIPAMILNRYCDVLAANAAAQALSAGMRPGLNRIRWEFLDPEARRSNPDWQRSAAAAIAHLRAQTRTGISDDRFHQLVGELTVNSDDFRRLWARHDVHTATGGVVTINHPTAGPLRLLTEKFAYTGNGGLELLLFHPEAGSRTAKVVAALIEHQD